MMVKVRIQHSDEVFIKVLTQEQSVEYELSDHFKFRVPNFQFNPKFKARIWDGFIRFFNRSKKTIYKGLLEDIIKFCEDREYEVELDPALIQDQKKISLKDFLSTITHFQLRDYQIDAVETAVAKKRTLLLSATASGKSLIIYSLLRYYSEQKCLVIVPTINLVGQMISDFSEYASKDSNFNVDSECHAIYAGQNKHTDKRIVVSTWQSLYKLPKSYFDQFEFVLVDECHLAKSTSIKDILENMTNAKYRFGTTGTLDGMLTNKMVIQGLLGPVYKVTTTNKLIEQGYLSSLSVKCVILKYSEAERKLARKFKYVDEVDFVLSHEKRNKFITNLTLSCKHNTLLLFNFIERHGKILFEMIKEKLDQQKSTRKIFFVSGATDADTRNEIRSIVEKETDAIIVASSAVFSTGVNIKNLVNVIFSHSGKSRVRTLQSIGRVLRIGNTDFANLYDIVDDLSHKKHKSYSLKHFVERYKMYQEEKFNLKMLPVPLETKKVLPEQQ